MKKTLKVIVCLLLSLVVIRYTQEKASAVEESIQGSTSTSSSIVDAESSTSNTSSTMSSSTKTTMSSSDSETIESSTTESSTTTNETRQVVKSQRIHIQKLFNQVKVTEDGTEGTIAEGVNGAHFSIYNITDLLEEVVETNSGNSIDEVEQELKERAGKLNLSDMTTYAAGVTETVGDKMGIFEFTTEESNERNQAYYIVNDSVQPDTATLSDPLVLITPITDENGVTMEDVWIYPKSTPVDQKKEIRTLPSTGVERGLLQKIWDYVTNLL